MYERMVEILLSDDGTYTVIEMTMVGGTWQQTTKSYGVPDYKTACVIAQDFMEKR